MTNFHSHFVYIYLSLFGFELQSTPSIKVSFRGGRFGCLWFISYFGLHTTNVFFFHCIWSFGPKKKKTNPNTAKLSDQKFDSILKTSCVDSKFSLLFLYSYLNLTFTLVLSWFKACLVHVVAFFWRLSMCWCVKIHFRSSFELVSFIFGRWRPGIHLNHYYTFEILFPPVLGSHIKIYASSVRPGRSKSIIIISIQCHQEWIFFLQNTSLMIPRKIITFRHSLNIN